MYDLRYPPTNLDKHLNNMYNPRNRQKRTSRASTKPYLVFPQETSHTWSANTSTLDFDLSTELGLLASGEPPSSPLVPYLYLFCEVKKKRKLLQIASYYTPSKQRRKSPLHLHIPSRNIDIQARSQPCDSTLPRPIRVEVQNQPDC